MKPRCCRSFLRAASVALVFLCGACMQLSGDTAQETTAKAEPQLPTPHLARGRYLLIAGEPEMAMKEFLNSISEDGISVTAYTGAGIAAQRQGLLISAKRYFQRARDLAPDSVVANNNLGVVLYKLKEYYPAQRAFQTAYALSSGTSETAERNLNLIEAELGLEGHAETDPTITPSEILLEVGEGVDLTEEALPETEISAE